MSVVGQELIDGRAFLDACEAKWLVTLVEFDDAAAYELDGHLTTVSWLVDRCGMGKSTAKEKVRIGRELRDRPVVRDAFLDGRLTYSKARALTRLVGLNDGRDAAIIAEFAQESADALERLVRWWNLRNGDDDKPERPETPQVQFHPGFSGANGRVVIEGPNEDLARLVNLLDAYGAFLFFNAQEASVKPVGSEASVKPVGPHGSEASVKPADTEASVKPPVLRADNTDEPAFTTAAVTAAPYEDIWEPEADDEASVEPPLSLAQRRFSWLFDLIEEIALVHDDQVDPDRASIAVTVPYESLVGAATESSIGVLDAGPIITGEALRRLACDCGVSRMVVKGAAEILDTGRKTRTWSKAQRRAIRARHGHRCAVRGCNRRITQIHHLIFWEHGGTTCIENGVPLCSRHHHMVHDLGWKITWDHRTGITTFTGPERQVLYSEADPFLVRPPAFAA